MIEINDVSSNPVEASEGKFVPLSHLSCNLPDVGLVLLSGDNYTAERAFFKMICGLQGPASGSIRVFGTDVSLLNGKMWSEYLRRVVACVFSDGAQENRLSVYDSAFLFSCDSKTWKEASSKTRNVLSSLGLSGIREQPIKTLSKEETWVTSLARGVAKESKVLLVEFPSFAISEIMMERAVATLVAVSREKLVVVSCQNLSAFGGKETLTLDFSPEKVSSLCAEPEAEQKERGGKRADTERTLPRWSRFRLGLKSFFSRPFLLAALLALGASGLGFFGVYDSLNSVKQSEALTNSVLERGNDWMALKAKKDGKDILFADEELSTLRNAGDPRMVPTYRLRAFEYDLFKSTPLFLNGKPAGFKAEEEGILSPVLKDVIPLSSLSDLPPSYKLLCGTLPKHPDEVLLTNYHYEFFKLHGFIKNGEAKSENVLNPSDITGPEVLLGQPLLNYYQHGGHKICGFLQTSFDMEHFRPYMSYLSGSSKVPEEKEAVVQALKLELEGINEGSYATAAYVHPYFLKMALNTGDYFPIVEDSGSSISAEIGGESEPYRGSSYRTLYNFGVSGRDENPVAFYPGESVGEDGIVLPIDAYIEEYLYYAGFDIYKTLEVTIPHDFVYGATEDTKKTLSFKDLFLSEPIRLASNYLTSKYFDEAYEKSEFDLDRYSKTYYRNRGEEVPETISEADKKAILRLCIFNYVSGYDIDLFSEGFYGKIRSQGLQMMRDFIQPFFAQYQKEYFKVRQYRLISRDGRAEPDSQKTVSFKIVGFVPKGCYGQMSPTRAKQLLRDGGGIYGRAIMPLPVDPCLVANVVATALEGGDYQYSFIGIQENVVREDIPLYEYIFLGVSLGLLAFAFVGAFFGGRALTRSESWVNGTLVFSGAGEKDLDRRYLVTAGILSGTSFLLSLPIMFVTGWLLNGALASKASVSFSILTVGFLPVLCAFGLSLVIFGISYWAMHTSLRKEFPALLEPFE